MLRQVTAVLRQVAAMLRQVAVIEAGDLVLHFPAKFNLAAAVTEEAEVPLDSAFPFQTTGGIHHRH